MTRVPKNKKRKTSTTSKTNRQRRQATALTYIMVSIRLFVVLFAIVLTWLLLHDQEATGHPASTAGTLSTVALAASARAVCAVWAAGVVAAEADGSAGFALLPVLCAERSALSVANAASSCCISVAESRPAC